MVLSTQSWWQHIAATKCMWAGHWRFRCHVNQPAGTLHAVMWNGGVPFTYINMPQPSPEIILLACLYFGPGANGWICSSLNLSDFFLKELSALASNFQQDVPVNHYCEMFKNTHHKHSILFCVYWEVKRIRSGKLCPWHWYNCVL